MPYPRRQGRDQVPHRRVILAPALREAVAVAVPGDRGPSKLWKQGLPTGTAAAAGNTGKPIHVGYGRCPAVKQELQSQLDALERAGCKRIFSEKISTRIKVRAELEKALKLAHDIKEAAPDQPVILTVYELKRLARNAAELMTLSATLQAGNIQLEFLTGPLTGVYDPGGMGSMLFAVVAVAARRGRNYIREKTWRARSSPRARATTAAARKSSTTTCSSSAAR